MSLLDFLESPGARLGMGLLAAAGPRPLAQSGLGDRMMSVMDGLDKRKERESELEQRKQAYAMRQMQMEAAKASMLDDQAVRQAFMPMQGGAAMQNGQGPTTGNARNLGQMPQFDPRQFLSQNPQASMGALKQAMEMQQAMQPKVPKFSTAPQYDQNGRAFILAEDGSMKYLDGVKARDKLNEVRLGDKVGFRTDYSPDMVGSQRIGQSPDSVASNQTSMRGQNMTDARARERFSFDQGAQIADAGGPSQAPLVKLFGKPEAGFRWKPDGSSEPIPGGSKDMKAGIDGAKNDARRQSGIAQAGVVLATVQEAKDLVGMSTAGYGSWLAGMPNTDARNLAGKLTTIKANLGFDRLQQMRDQSPTGGALGQVAVQELVALQATVASLDQGQTAEQLNGALAKIEKHYNNWLKTIEGPQAGGAPASDLRPAASAKLPTPMKGMVRDGYKFKGGDPSNQSNWERQ